MQNFFEAVTSRAHAWPAHRRDLHWHLLPETAPDREELSRPYRGVLGEHGLEVVDDEWLHVTVLHSGPHQDATGQTVQEIITRVRDAVAGTGPIALTFARPSVGTVAVERAGRPGQPARRLWTATWEATTAVAGDRWPRIPATSYYPHVTLAYAGRNAQQVDRGAVKAALADVDAGESKIMFTRLALVSQWHDGHRIVWDPMTTIRLDTPRITRTSKLVSDSGVSPAGR